MEKVKFEVTLKQLRKAGACVSGYNKLARSLQGQPYTAQDEARESWLRFAYKDPINLLTILESNGVNDCLWALRAVVHPDLARIVRYIACDSAEFCLHNFESRYPEDMRVRNCINTARKFADGIATEEDRHAARSAAQSAAQSAAEYAARSAAGYAAESAAGYAVWYAAAQSAGAAVRSAARSGAESTAWAAFVTTLRTYLTM